MAMVRTCSRQEKLNEVEVEKTYYKMTITKNMIDMMNLNRTRMTIILMKIIKVSNNN